MLRTNLLRVQQNIVRSASTVTAKSADTSKQNIPPAVPNISTGGYKFDNKKYGKDIVLVEGVRTPFTMAGTAYNDLINYEILREAIKGLMSRVPLDKSQIDYVVAGTVIGEPKIPNVAREAMIAAGLSDRTPASTVTQACVSANQAIASAIGSINTGTYEVVIAGGVETASDVPIRHSRKMRKLLLQLNKAKTAGERLKIISQLRLDYFEPELPAIAEYFTNEVMGHSSDRLTAAFGISRREQDEFALRSHANADKAFIDGNHSDIVPVFIPGKGYIKKDNGVRPSNIDKVSKLKAAFIKPFGTATAANSSYLTDGATACLITTAEKAKELGLKPKAYLRQHLFVSQDFKDQLLLGPAYVTARLLERTGLKAQEIDVWEYHEAFSGQVLANLKALDCDYFSENYIKPKGQKVGKLDENKINSWGGSLSIGHPFGATGVRLVTMAANRLIKEDKRLGLIAACAAGGIGHGMIVERYVE